MKKTITLISLFIVPVLLTGCGDKEHDRKVRCTELQNENSKALRGEGERNLTEIRKEWDTLKCEQSDIING